MTESAQCPFCGFTPTQSNNEMLLHIETLHGEEDGLSPLKALEDPIIGHDKTPAVGKIEEGPRSRDIKTSAPADSRNGSLRHQRPGSASSSNKKPAVRSSTSQPSVVQAWKEMFNGYKSQSSKDIRRVRHKSKLHEKPPSTANSPIRVSAEEPPSSSDHGNSSSSKLGKSELGRHHNEKHMPAWLATLLEAEKGVCDKAIISVLQQLLEQSPSTLCAYICSPCVQHVSKLRREGSFCGYRNIQMLISHIISAETTGAELFGESFPTISHIQDLIEHAWDSGFNAQGRVETGGIKGTRKYIGTPEVQALFSSLGIPCPVQAFKDKDRLQARTILLCTIEAYFKQGARDFESKVHATALPPIYFQHRGHSLTIIGFEKHKDGHVNLLVFDPSYRDSSIIRELVGTTFKHPKSKINSALEPYRRGIKYLRKYNEFEVLYLTNSIPAM